MKKVLAILVMAGIVCLMLPACEEGSSGSGGGGAEGQRVGEQGIPEGAVTASSFDSDVEPLRPDQDYCLVCGKRPIKEDIYADVDTPGGQRRAYFDKEECRQTFNNNRDKFLQGITEE